MVRPGKEGGVLRRDLFPFAAVVGQEDLKTSLMLCAVNPAVGGVLIRGEKGTAKSTLVRALADILPELETAADCAFSCDPARPQEWCERCRERAAANRRVKKRRPILTLPLNATEDRVTGSLDFEEAVRSGRRVVSPGLLAAAHRGILYVDEVNLLDDHLVDIILDAAASGENRLEREGLSFRHPARFMLIGTMNPEEGELRPQFLDRFGLSVAVNAEPDEKLRVELMLRREEFDLDPAAFQRRYADETAALRLKLSEAGERLPLVEFPKRLRKFVAELAMGSHAAGHRADLFMEQAALAMAALEGALEATEAQVMAVAPLVLAHRRREAAPPPPPPPPPEEDKEKENEKQAPEEPEKAAENPEEAAPPPEKSRDEERENASPPETGDNQDEGGPEQSGAPEDNHVQIGETFRVKSIQAAKDRLRRRGSGRRSRSRVSQKQGRYVKSGPDRGGGDLALDATLRAAAPYQLSRPRTAGLAVTLTPADIREKEREKRLGNFLFFTVDASGSMGARGRMAASKGAIMSLLLDAYQKRDRVALISFRRGEASLNLPLTASIDLAGKLLAELPVGGRTPLSAGLSRTWLELRNALTKNPLARPIVVLITDGRSNVALGEGKPLDEALRLASVMGRDERIKYIVVDTEEPGAVTFGLASQLAAALSAAYFKINDLKADALVNIVKGNLEK
ncbi:MAG: magnesium chelatase subunit D family protein [Candidatus Adiutrix sp.]|jgi:magnesium chelatase subunit D|nr:magnesium chelatase subunit D family protein [Candidatus Adiutrix sp.]